MREILFRGKNIYKEEWIYGDLRHIWDIFKEDLVPCIVPTPKDTRNNNVCGVRVIPETVGQYAGLTDKNGKKIFEGDIIKGKGKKDLYIVEYSQATAAFTARGLNGHPYPVVCKGTMTYYEVIGSIHDSPALFNSTDVQLLNEITQNTFMPATPENFELMQG